MTWLDLNVCPQPELNNKKEKEKAICCEKTCIAAAIGAFSFVMIIQVTGVKLSSPALYSTLYV